ncbi:glycosyltransferase family 4 protein [Vreelandella janggokensis]|uniref:glycosyltransferase family 4 protein n=1 Tax=Vreelandella janggokensis TaxID=370767 RepID=UPI00285914D4|nr:glycosyltransferase family 4 protein [Halomonas janggokensis]MDR5886702.1 glycosyltransferase family 4 protein [Halomonas janggokensis]
MKILMVNTSDIEGGAARAAYRLHRALLAEGVDSQMLVQRKVSDDITVIGPITKVQKAWYKIRPFLDSWPVHRYKNRTKTLFSPSCVPFSGVVDRINEMNPDVVHLHWVTGGMMRIEDIVNIKAPIVWSLHDNWAFTGGCHIMWSCSRYQKNCGACPVLASSKDNDLSRQVFLRKQRAFDVVNSITVVGLSTWLHNCAARSQLFSSHQHTYLPNPIDTKVFSPADKTYARSLLNLPQDKKLVLFGAISATSDVNKGYNELSKALQLIDKNVDLVVFGASQPEQAGEFTQKAHYLGRLYDDVTLRLLYSAADVMVVPSLQEAFGQTASEAMACGTPVVAFGATGLLDIVDHKKNGFLAEPFDIQDLARGIEWVLSHEPAKNLSISAVNKIKYCFDYKVVAPQYINLYQTVLKKDKL